MPAARASGNRAVARRGLTAAAARLTAAARLIRDDRIAELDRRRWSLRRIAAEVHLSHVAVRKILARQMAARKAGRAGREAEILKEMEVLRIGLAMRQARMNVIRRELVALMEEDEASNIDELLGL